MEVGFYFLFFQFLLYLSDIIIFSELFLYLFNQRPNRDFDLQIC
jgi:hypothetical protein